MSLRRKIALVLLGILLLTPSTLLYFVASTERGLRFVTTRLAKLEMVRITTSDVEGTLIGGFRIGSLRVEHRLSDVRIEDLSGSVDLLPLLLLRRINIPDFHAQHVSVQALRSTRQPPRREPRFLPPMMRLEADRVRIDDVTLTLLSGRVLEGSGAVGAVTMLPHQIRIRDAHIDYGDMQLAAAMRLYAARPLGLAGDLDIHWQPQRQPLWQIHSRFDGNLDRLPLTVDIVQPFSVRAEGAATTLNKGWQFAGNADVRDVDLQEFGAGSALGILSGRLAVTAQADGFTAKGEVTPPGLKAGAFQVDFRGAYARKRLTIHDASALHPGSGARATTRGTVDVVEGGPELDLAGDWTRMRWPLPATEPAFFSPAGRYTIAGTRPWAVTAAGDVDAAGQSAMPATLQGRLGSDALAIEAATLGVLGGNANVTGEARWKPAERWQVAGTMRGFDPARIRADLPGRLDFDFTAAGAPFGAAGSIEFAVARLNGTLRDQRASGKGQFMRPGGSADWRFRDVDMRLGRTRLQLDGRMGADNDLQFAIDADDLSLFDAEARGRLNARGRFAGTFDTPVLMFKARGAGFQWRDLQLEELDADVDLDLNAGGHAQGQIDIAGLTVGTRSVQSASASLTGTASAQRIALTIEAAPLRTAMTLQGAMRDGLWQGTLQEMVIDDVADLTLRLESPAPVQFGARQFSFGQSCVKAEQERFCGNARLLPEGGWTSEFSAESLPLRTFTAGLTQDIEYDGTINLRGTLAGEDGGLPTGSVRGELMHAQLRHRLTNGREETVPLGSGTISASATTDTFAVQVGLDAGATARIRGELNGQRSDGDWRDFPIAGSLDASTDALSLLDMYVGDIDKATGHLTTRVQVSGTLGAPTLEGLLQLRDASIDVYQVNLSLRGLTMDARFDANALDLTGQSKLGEGTAKFSGRLAWRDNEPYGNLKVQGERLLIVNVPEARIEASPDLDFKLAGRSIEIRGKVELPVVRIEPADLTGAVLPSGDEVLAGTPPVDPEQRWSVVSDIQLVLGDQVHLDSLGLTARLGGSLEVKSDAAGNSRGLGELNISEGKYSALGRQLDIERGRLIFDNVPIGDPGVDLRARKVYPDITAGVIVRGRLRRPAPLIFYSEPAIPQSQIASLILAGGSLESLQGEQRAGAARNDLLAQGGAILAQRLGSRVGVDDVGIESDLSNDTSLVLGKYLSPRLYVSYGISLAEAINTLKLRYTIGDRWTIKTEAGKARSADIVYTFKKKQK